MVVRFQRVVALASTLVFFACAPAQKEISSRGVALELSSNTSSIIGGNDVVPTEISAQSTVILYDTVKKAVCTGSLIGNNLVLTAAHCLGQDPKKSYVVFTLNLSKATQQMARPVVGAIAHPLFAQVRGRRATDVGDIALIKYQGTTPTGYRPVNVLPNSSILKNGLPTTVVGYGMSDSIRKTGVGILRQVSTTISNARFSQTELQLEQRTGRGACHGDSGGPAFIVSNGVYYLWGVTSRGDQDLKDQCNTFSVYTNVLAYMKWIQDNGKILAQNNQFQFTPTERTFGRGSEL